MYTLARSSGALYFTYVSVDFYNIFIIFSLETGILSYRILSSGAILPALECILSNAKKCTL